MLDIFLLLETLEFGKNLCSEIKEGTSSQSKQCSVKDVNEVDLRCSAGFWGGD